MTNSKMTKRALLTSVMALFLCFAMLTGTTFAWFTDQETSANNKIIAGNLDIELYHQGADDAAAIKVDSSTADLFQDVTPEKWEPGAIAYETFTLKNVGNLAFKYDFTMSVGAATVIGEYSFADLLKVTVVEGEFAPTGRIDTSAYVWTGFESLTKTGKLYPVDYAETGTNFPRESQYTVIVWWAPSAVDNVFNIKEEVSAEFKIQLFATQLNAEEDAFGPEYDVDAPLSDADAWDGTATEDIEANKNTAEKTLVIESAADLAAFRDEVNGGNAYSGWTVTLASDIDLLNKAWTPIGGGANVFAGTFDGAGHTVYNLNVDVAEQAGLFGAATGATIENINVVNATIKSNHFAGAILAQGYATVTNCSVDNAEVVCVPELIGTSYDNGDKAGILVGWMADHTISGNTVKNSSVKGYRDIGGIAGYANDENRTAFVLNNTVENCTIILDGTTNAYGSASKNGKPVVGRNEIADAAAVADNTVTNTTVLEMASAGLAKDTDGNYYVYDAAGLAALNTVFTNGAYGHAIWGATFNIMADIDATGITWTSVGLNTPNNQCDGFTWNGNGHTISNLTISGPGLFASTANGKNSNVPVTFKNLTIDNATVSSGYHVGILWGQMYGDLVVDNVHITNSSVTGTCNVGAFIGRNGDEGASTVAYKNCSVTNTTVKANGGGDPNGASVFQGSALSINGGATVAMSFEGCTQSGNTIVNPDGLAGGGIYATWNASTNDVAVVSNFN